jgi:BASS family bile acid:Na+ symporter
MLLAVRALAAAYLVTMMFSMGLELGGAPKEDKHEKWHKRWLLVRALAFNLLLLPLVAVTLTHVMHSSGDLMVAFLLLAASPGGRFAPHLAKSSGADLGLSVEITLFLNKMIPLTAPITAAWMLHSHRVELSELKFIAALLVLQFVPYTVGRQIRKRRPEWAARLQRPFERISWLILVPVLALVVAAHPLRDVPALGADRTWWVVLAFGVLAPALGWLLGGPAAETRRAFSVSANARNLAVAFVIAGEAFGGREVQLATFAVWAVFLVLEVSWVRLSTKGRIPMKRMVLMVAALGLGAVGVAHAQTQETEHPCMADAARLCSNVEPGGGAQMTCLKAHKEELSPACKKKVMQAKIKQMENQELQKQESAPPQP